MADFPDSQHAPAKMTRPRANTARTHIRSVFRKFQVASRTAAVLAARELGLA